MSSQKQNRRELLSRAEAILDAWLSRYEVALGNAEPGAKEPAISPPDLSKTTELAGLFAIVERVVKIETLLNKLEDGQEADAAHELSLYELDPDEFSE